ncbi:MAG: manganese efflux pump [Phycisphaerae bacterium]|nr:manganese efflux pump [Phycisphaerae bacterium]
MTTFWSILAIAVGLGADAMSVSAAVGVKWHGRGQKFRLAWSMGLFQFLMPLAGWAVGQSLAGVLHQYGTYIAATLVFAVGVKMLYEAWRNHPGQVAEAEEEAIEKALHRHPKDPTRGWSLLVLAVATSLDALVVGFSLALKGMTGFSSIWLPCVEIGMVAAAMSLAGVLLGQYVGKAIGRPAEFLGALVLTALAVSFLFV